MAIVQINEGHKSASDIYVHVQFSLYINIYDEGYTKLVLVHTS